MMSWYGNGLGTLALVGMGAVWLILLGLIVWLIVRLLTRISGDKPSSAMGESAVEILDQRLSSGELGVQVWQAQRAALVAAQRDGE